MPIHFRKFNYVPTNICNKGAIIEYFVSIILQSILILILPLISWKM